MSEARKKEKNTFFSKKDFIFSEKYATIIMINVRGDTRPIKIGGYINEARTDFK